MSPGNVSSLSLFSQNYISHFQAFLQSKLIDCFFCVLNPYNIMLFVLNFETKRFVFIFSAIQLK